MLVPALTSIIFFLVTTYLVHVSQLLHKQRGVRPYRMADSIDTSVTCSNAVIRDRYAQPRVRFSVLLQAACNDRIVPRIC